jgi:molybdate transport system substrate-binding protein
VSDGLATGGPTPGLQLLCAGAVQGLVRALEVRWREATGAPIVGRFGAVGAMKDALLAGAPCDVLVVTDAMLRELGDAGAVDRPSIRAIGRVRTGVAARSGEAIPALRTPDALKAALLAAPAIYVPDTVKSTAGAHVVAVLERLGIGPAVAARLAVFPNGATAMKALAEQGAPGALGCTQVTEILCTPGLALAGALPDPLGLATVYGAGTARNATDAALAARFIDLLCGDAAETQRRAGGFEPAPNP